MVGQSQTKQGIHSSGFPSIHPAPSPAPPRPPLSSVPRGLSRVGASRVDDSVTLLLIGGPRWLKGTSLMLPLIDGPYGPEDLFPDIYVLHSSSCLTLMFLVKSDLCTPHAARSDL
jgi:hypothetical protein